jgi:hypothetical protein
LDGLSEALGKKVSKEMLKKFLKRLGYSYRRIRKRLKKSPNPVEYEQKVKELQTLIELEQDGFLTIYYADESGFSETPCVPYGWQPKGEPLSIPSQRGARCNVFGLMSRENELHAYSTLKRLDSAFVICAIDDFVLNKCDKGRSVIVLDNARVHHSEVFKAKIVQWEEQNVFIFYLPTYSPHLNLIETFWRKCKYEWLTPEHFVSWKAILAQIDDIMQHFGSKYTINFS